MRDLPLYKRIDDIPISGVGADVDEEAQATSRQELDFEDITLLSKSLSSRPKHFLRSLHGPDPPRTLSIRPLFPRLQKTPIKWLEARAINKHVLLGLALLVWFLLFILFLGAQRPIQDGESKSVLNLDCVDMVWKRKNECGIDGVNCRPFSNQTFAFRCPAKCGDVKILNPHVVGPREFNYRPLVIGTGAYRGDSFVCGAAIHAGVINDRTGGCGRIKLVGSRDNFPSTTQNGIESIPFDSYFPLSFTLAADDNFRCSPDPRSALLPVSLFFTAALAIFSTSPKIFFPIFMLIFAHVSFASDPPSASYHNTTVLPDHVSMFAKRLLPAMFVAVVIYLIIIKRTLSGLTAQFEKTLLWLGGFWIGALSNYTFDWIPISRLTAHDLKQQPGAWLALVIIVVTLLMIILGQMMYFWVEGRLLRYLSLYGLFISGILVCLMIPGVNLRIHHYILALLLLPGTNIQTRPSLLYQGILLGLFVNGIARWDFDSILQTSAALRADARFDSLVPSISEPTVQRAAESMIATFTYGAHPAGMDGISVLVNDVERDRSFFDDGLDGNLSAFNWTQSVWGLNEYFRFAYVKGGRTLDYSKTGTITVDGTWQSGEPR